MTSTFDIAVIGGGAAGCTAAVEAARLGARVVLIEQERRLGGVSWHRRRLPARLLQAAVRTHRSTDADTIDPSVVELSKLLPDLDARRREQAEALSKTLQKSGVMRLHARARLISPHSVALTTVHGATHQITAERIIIATGDRPRSPRGARIDHEAVLDMGSVLSAVYLPRSVVVAGEGPSACEMATLLGHLGCEVTLAVPGGRVLEGLDPVLAAPSSIGLCLTSCLAITKVHVLLTPYSILVTPYFLLTTHYLPLPHVVPRHHEGVRSAVGRHSQLGDCVIQGWSDSGME